MSIEDGEGFAFHSLNLNALRAEIISYGNIVKKGGMLNLLHEIAHVWNPEKDYKNLINRFVSCLAKRIKHNKPIEKIFEMIDPFLMADRMVEIEKKAWTDAHHMLLFLRDRGVDLEPEMNINDLNKHVNSCLDTYKEFADSFLQFFKHRNCSA